MTDEDDRLPDHNGMSLTRHDWQNHSSLSSFTE